MPNSDAKLMRVALYARVSTEEQKEGKTINPQVEEIERFAKDKGWLVTQIYKDDGWSGSLLIRPALDCLRDDAGRGLFDAVLVNDVDRLARDVSHLGILKRDLERKGARLVFRKLPLEASPTHNLMVNILGSFAEFERELIIDRTRRGRRHKVETAKQYVGCVAPYGYHYEAGTGTEGNSALIKIIPEEARVVRKIYGLALAGVSMNKIAARLTSEHIPTRTGRPAWHSSIVCKILRNETYAGIWSYGKSESCEPGRRRRHNTYRRCTKTSHRNRPKSDWFRIPLPQELTLIDASLWNQTQERINKNRRFSPRNAKSFYLLKGLVRCGYCSSTCAGASTSKPGGPFYWYYRCWRRKACKEARWIPMKGLDEIVWSALRRAFQDPARLSKRLIQAQDELLAEQSAEAQSDASPQQRQAEGEALLFHRYRQGELSPQQLADELEEIRDRLREEDTPEMPTAVELRRSVDELCGEVQQKLNSPTRHIQQGLIRRLVREISIDKVSARIRFQIPTPSHAPAGSDAIPEVVHEAGVAGNANVPSAIVPSELRERGCNTRIQFEVTEALPCSRRRDWRTSPVSSVNTFTRA